MLLAMPADDAPSLASYANLIISEQKYAAKQAAFMDAQRARREKGATFSSAKEQRDRGRARGNANRSPWTRERVLAAMRAWHAEHGEWPTTWTWRSAEKGRPTATRVQAVFGTWAAAMKEAQG